MRPTPKALVAALLAGLLVLLVWAGLGRVQLAAGESPEASRERAGQQARARDLTHELRQARAEVSRLRSELAAAKQQLALDAEATKALRNTLGVIENESARFREQLAFYKGMAKPGEMRAGVRVQDFKIRPKDGELHYELVLIQSVRAEQRIAGTVEVNVEGRRGDATLTFPLKGMVTGGDRDLVFSFKYYDEFAGNFKLPEGFTPDKLIVTLKAVNDRPVASEEFPWNMVAATTEISHD